MRKLLLLSFLLCGCSVMSPSTKIFEVARTRDSKGNPKTASFKVFESQADFLGETEIQTKHVRVRTKGGIIHSVAVREHWKGIHKTSTGVLQPLILGPIAGSAFGQGIGLAKGFAP